MINTVSFMTLELDKAVYGSLSIKKKVYAIICNCPALEGTYFSNDDTNHDVNGNVY